MIVKQFGFILLAFTLISSGLSKSIEKKVNKELKAVFSSDEVSLQTMTFSEEIHSKLPMSFDKTTFYKTTLHDSLIGFAYIGKAPSKTDDFEFLVVFDKDLVIKKSKVLIYREDYGGEIASKRWLKQFIGRTKEDTLTLGDNISAISGATISVRSMTKAMNDLLLAINILIQNDQL